MAFKMLFTITIIFLIPGILAIDEKLVRERKVSEIDPDLDLAWMSTVAKWYLPAWSKLDRTRTASDLYKKKVSELTENEVNIPACIIFNTRTNLVTGFNQKVSFKVDPIMQDGKMIGMDFKGSGNDALSGKFLFKLTDNESFILGSTFWSDGEASWAVMSTKPKLDDDDKTQILAMVKGLGYTEKMFVMESYDKCDLGKNEL